MSRSKLNRRTFLKSGLATGAAAVAASRMTAASYGRTIGAKDRINVGLIGCGGRGRLLLEKVVQIGGKGAALVAVCDIFKSRLDDYCANREKVLGLKPKMYHDRHKLLENPDIDAVVIATPDHQHCGFAIDAVQAGKHVYVEKPLPGLICDLPELNKLYDTVKASKQAVQTGTQGASCLGVHAIKKVIAEGTLGKLFRIESTETGRKPYWMHYKGPATEAETDWKAWLYNRPHRPFDAKMHAKWMGYKEITSGTIGGWMSHFINLVHYVTDCGYPKSASAWGGRYAPETDRDCTSNDQTNVILEYPEGFHTVFTSHFGNTIDDEKTLFMFENGIIRCKFGHAPGNPIISAEGAKKEFEAKNLLDAEPPSPLELHIKNWLDCIRTGQQPNAHMGFGHKHGIAVVMGDLSWTLNRRVIYDTAEREVRPG